MLLFQSTQDSVSSHGSRGWFNHRSRDSTKDDLTMGSGAPSFRLKKNRNAGLDQLRHQSYAHPAHPSSSSTSDRSASTPGVANEDDVGMLFALWQKTLETRDGFHVPFLPRTFISFKYFFLIRAIALMGFVILLGLKLDGYRYFYAIPYWIPGLTIAAIMLVCGLMDTCRQVASASMAYRLGKAFWEEHRNEQHFRVPCDSHDGGDNDQGVVVSEDLHELAIDDLFPLDNLSGVDLSANAYRRFATRPAGVSATRDLFLRAQSPETLFRQVVNTHLERTFRPGPHPRIPLIPRGIPERIQYNNALQELKEVMPDFPWYFIEHFDHSQRGSDCRSRLKCIFVLIDVILQLAVTVFFLLLVWVAHRTERAGLTAFLQNDTQTLDFLFPFGFTPRSVASLQSTVLVGLFYQSPYFMGAFCLMYLSWILLFFHDMMPWYQGVFRGSSLLSFLDAHSKWSHWVNVIVLALHGLVFVGLLIKDIIATLQGSQESGWYVFIWMARLFVILITWSGFFLIHSFFILCSSSLTLSHPQFLFNVTFSIGLFFFIFFLIHFPLIRPVWSLFLPLMTGLCLFFMRQYLYHGEFRRMHLYAQRRFLTTQKSPDDEHINKYSKWWDTLETYMNVKVPIKPTTEEDKKKEKALEKPEESKTDPSVKIPEDPKTDSDNQKLGCVDRARAYDESHKDENKNPY